MGVSQPLTDPSDALKRKNTRNEFLMAIAPEVVRCLLPSLQTQEGELESGADTTIAVWAGMIAEALALESEEEF